MRNFLPPPLHSPPFPSPPIASSIPFSIQCPPVAIVNRFTAASNRKPAVDQLSASSEPRFSRSGIDGPSTLCRNFSSRHRLLHYKSPLRKIDAARGSPLFQRLFPTLFRFFFFLTVLNLANWYLRERNWFSSTINRAKAIISRIRILENY